MKWVLCLLALSLLMNVYLYVGHKESSRGPFNNITSFNRKKIPSLKSIDLSSKNRFVDEVVSVQSGIADKEERSSSSYEGRAIKLVNALEVDNSSIYDDQALESEWEADVYALLVEKLELTDLELADYNQLKDEWTEAATEVLRSFNDEDAGINRLSMNPDQQLAISQLEVDFYDSLKEMLGDNGYKDYMDLRNSYYKKVLHGFFGED